MPTLPEWVYKSKEKRRLRTKIEHQYLRVENRERRRKMDGQKGQGKIQPKGHHGSEAKQ